ncbi:MAG: 30S ribosomal protein S26e [Candidatus Bathyarchaeia archaeon]
MSSRITRKKGQSGRAAVVQCIQCGKMIPRDKAVEKRKSTLPLDRRLRQLLKKQGAYLSTGRSIVYYCVSCAKHRKYV